MSELDHERLQVFQEAVAFVESCQPLLREIPTGRAHLGDQLDRAATSIVLNIAEGAGEFSPGDKARFYRMARRSATECSAILTVCRLGGFLDASRHEEARTRLHAIVRMLATMSMRNESKARLQGRRR